MLAKGLHLPIIAHATEATESAGNIHLQSLHDAGVIEAADYTEDEMAQELSRAEMIKLVERIGS
ncbi:hypothetical protein [Paenibacillus xerothermodurans]|nr:hypothetical protein [Paenibacillus xerothermodurans]